MMMAGLWTTARARRAAVEAIVPMVDCTRARLGAISDASWSRPYVLGFLTMLISLVVNREVGGKMQSDLLALAQAGAWRRITGLGDDRFGEAICLLSANGDADFLCGCTNAVRFLEARQGAYDCASSDIGQLFNSRMLDEGAELTPAEARAFGDNGAIVAALWQHYFDERIARD